MDVLAIWKYFKERQTFKPDAPWFFFNCFSESLGYESSHPVGGLLLHLPRNMGVGVQCEARTIVSQNAGHRFDIHTLLDS